MTSRTPVVAVESEPATELVAAEQVVAHVRQLVERGDLKPGDRLPAERELARKLGVSRSTVRAGLRSLAAIKIVQTRRGAGTFVADGPPALGAQPLEFLAALHGFTRDEMFEARRVLEVGVVGLTAERATSDEIAVIADEVANGFATRSDPQVFLVHDIRFHRAIAAACGNPILGLVVEMVSALFYQQRRASADRGTDLAESAGMHQRVYQAIRAHDRPRAEAAMNEHLRRARQAQHAEQDDASASGTSAGREADPATAARACEPRLSSEGFYNGPYIGKVRRSYE